MIRAGWSTFGCTAECHYYGTSGDGSYSFVLLIAKYSIQSQRERMQLQMPGFSVTKLQDSSLNLIFFCFGTECDYRSQYTQLLNEYLSNGNKSAFGRSSLSHILKVIYKISVCCLHWESKDKDFPLACWLRHVL